MGAFSRLDLIVRIDSVPSLHLHRADMTRCSYSGAPEILKYFKGIADDYGLRKYIRLDHRVVGTTWDEDSEQWHVKIQRGDNSENVFEDRCHILVNASGVLKWVERLYN